MANLKFYFTPGSCTTGIHILLEELELVFEAHLMNLMKGDQHSQTYKALNPKGTIPTLVLPDGTALTDFMSIVWWLAASYPNKGLLPGSLTQQAVLIDWTGYVVNTLHGQGFTRIFTAEKYSVANESVEAIQRQGQDIVQQGFTLLEQQLNRESFLTESFSIFDAAFFYVAFWASRSGIDMPLNCLARYQTLLNRRAVRQVLAEEGYHSYL